MGPGWRDIMLQLSAVSPVSGCPGAATHPGHCCWYFHSRDPGVTCSLPAAVGEEPVSSLHDGDDCILWTGFPIVMICSISMSLTL